MQVIPREQDGQPRIDPAAGATTLDIIASVPDARGRRKFTARQGDHQITDTFKVDVARERRSFAKAVATHFSLADDARAVLEEQIMQAAANADSLAVVDALPPPSTVSPAEQVPAAIATAANAFLVNHYLIQELVYDLDRIGIVGEGPLALAIYLTGVSRLLANPLSAVVQSASASGKSFVVDKTLSLFPPEELIRATDLTPQALYYFGAEDLKNKIVFVAERKHTTGKDQADTANASLALREMISAGKLSKYLPIKGEDGMLVTECVELEGPIAYVATTTEDQILDEDATRLLALRTDESTAQTARIMNRQALEAVAGESDASSIIEKHRQAQRCLRGLHVCIPFARLLRLPESTVAARRYFPQLLRMIHAVALLRQHQKEEVNGWIEADLFDYEVAYHVMLPILNRHFAPLSEGACSLHAAIRVNGTERGQHFSRQDCVGWSGLSPTTVRNRLGELLDAGLINEQETRGPRNSCNYSLGHVNIGSAPLIGLITPDDLAEEVAP